MGVADMAVAPKGAPTWVLGGGRWEWQIERSRTERFGAAIKVVTAP
jgi:hypothetical protein